METHISSANIESTVKLLESGALDRNDISASLGISVTGARNIASFLLDNSIVGEYPKTSSKSGRKTNALYLRSDPIFAISDIFNEKIVTHFFGYSLSITDSITYNINDTLFWDDSFTSYIRSIFAQFPKLCGICFLCDGIPSDGRFIKSTVPILCNIPFSEIVHEHTGNISVMFENRYRYITDNTSGIVSVVSESNGILSTSVLYDGCIISRSTGDPRSIGDTRYGIRSFNKRLTYSQNSAEYISATADFFHMLFCLIETERIYFSSDRYSDPSILLKRITEELMLKYGYSPARIPELIPVNASSPATAVSLRRDIRNCYIKNLL